MQMLTTIIRLLTDPSHTADQEEEQVKLTEKIQKTQCFTHLATRNRYSI
jgi:hypothetical protein